MRFLRDNLLGSQLRIIFADSFQFADKLAEKVFTEARRIEEKYSRFNVDSYLMRLNSEVGKQVFIDRETKYLLTVAEEIKTLSGGFFDIAVKKFLDKTQYASGVSRRRTERAGDQKENEILEEEMCWNEEVEFGGLGKGYALDLVIKILTAHGSKNFLLDFGGDIYATGEGPNNKGWKVAFEHPINLDEAIGEVVVNDFFLASSSAQRRKWNGGHHLINPLNGESANNMLAVYVQSDLGIKADAWSTALYAMGFDFAKKMEKIQRLEFMLISNSLEIFKTGNFNGELYLK